MDPALESIEASILPSNVMLLDGLLDAAVLALPGLDCASYAADLKSLAAQVEDLTMRVAALAPAQEPERLKMSA
ncbi:MAG TPA: hypothetical protein VGB08_01260 [Allosphingosinicella sp.]|jgi:hypothetical protein